MILLLLVITIVEVMSDWSSLILCVVSTSSRYRSRCLLLTQHLILLLRRSDSFTPSPSHTDLFNVIQALSQ